MGGMRLQILSVPDCPNTSLLDGRLTEAIATLGLDLAVEHVTVADEAHARASGMNGSPTLLLDGVDPFAAPGVEPSVSCRLYPADGGGIDGAPSIAAIAERLSEA